MNTKIINSKPAPTYTPSPGEFFTTSGTVDQHIVFLRTNGGGDALVAVRVSSGAQAAFNPHLHTFIPLKLSHVSGSDAVFEKVEA